MTWRRKRTSKRRWIARFHMGKVIPYEVLLEHPKLLKRLVLARFLINQDAIQHA